MKTTAHPNTSPPGGIALNPIQTSPLPIAVKFRMKAWQVVNATLFRWSPARLRGFRRWLLVCFGAQIAPDSSVHNTARIDCPWNLQLGSRSSIGERAWVYALNRITVDDCSCIGHDVYLLTGTHDYNDPAFPLVTRPIHVGYGCWLAARAIVLPGITIGALAVVGAGAVVTSDLPGSYICTGNPARPIKRRTLVAGDSKVESVEGT